MSRQEPVERISLFIDGELSEMDRTEVERLIETDAEWASIHERLCRTSRAVGDFFRDSGAALPDDGKTDAVDRIVRASAASISPEDAKRLRTPRRRPGSMLVAVVLVLAVAAAAWVYLQDDLGHASYVESLNQRVSAVYFEAEVARSGSDKSYRVWLGPDGGLHLFIDGPDGKRHVAMYDGRVWEWRTGGASAQEVDVATAGDVAIAVLILQAWKSFRGVLQEPLGITTVGNDSVSDRLVIQGDETVGLIKIELHEGMPRSVQSGEWAFTSLKTLSLKPEDFTPGGSGVTVAPR